MDPNSVVSFVAQCKNADALHHLQSVIAARLKELSAPVKALCRMCNNRKLVWSRVDNKPTEVPCPKCTVDVEGD